jgi:hypothetical protein
MKKQMANANEEQLTEGFKKAVKDVGIELNKIRRVRKTSNHSLKIRCETEKDAEELRHLKWEKPLEGASVVKPVYGIVIHGVSKSDIDPPKRSARGYQSPT